MRPRLSLFRVERCPGRAQRGRWPHGLWTVPTIERCKIFPSQKCQIPGINQYRLSLQHFLIAVVSISPSERFPEDFVLSISMSRLSMVATLILFFSANLMAMLFSSIFEEYHLGIFPSTKLNMFPHFWCPMVGVDGFADVSI